MTTITEHDVEPTFFTATAADKPEFDPLDISARSFWLQTSEEREKTYRELRHQRPIS